MATEPRSFDPRLKQAYLQWVDIIKGTMIYWEGGCALDSGMR